MSKPKKKSLRVRIGPRLIGSKDYKPRGPQKKKGKGEKKDVTVKES